MSSEDRRPARPGVVLVGLPPADADMRATLARYVQRGYATVVAEAGDGADPERMLRAVETALAALRAGRYGNGRTAVVGWGVGGCTAYLALARLGADAAVAFGAVGIGRFLGEPVGARPLSFHFGDDDALVSLAEVRAIKGALEGCGVALIYRYPGVGAGFAVRGSPGYDAAAAEQAEQRAFALLDRLREGGG